MVQKNVDNFYASKNSTMYAISVNVHAGTLSLYDKAFPIFLVSACFRGLRWYTYCTENKKEGLYKPWLGPDSSRWLEYLFTSLFQIFIVVTAFGFANSDTVLGLCGMQSALV